ncbi:MAG: isochorismatase family cysteine hydrolase [Candidatus Moraniibacteriota bacterium]
MTPKVLILVDFEKEWTDKSSDYFVGDVSELIEKTNKLLDFCRKNNYKIIFTKHVEKDSNEEFAPNSENVEIIDEINKQDSDVIVEKNKISPFYQTDLEKHLEGIDEIVICGILTNLCVRSLAQDAYDRNFEITVIKDCCQAFDEETHNFTIKDLKATREEIEFINLNELLDRTGQK